MTEYEKRGFSSREEYLYWLAITHGLPVKQVTNSARSLGEAEDFGQLLTILDKIIVIKKCLFNARICTRHKKKAARRTKRRKNVAKRKGELP